MNRIKMYVNNLGRGVRVFLLSLAVIFVGAGIAQAATTISTNILTNGTLGATGVATFGATASTTISTAGVLTTPSATVNGALNAIGLATFGATASTTISTAGVLTTPSSATALFLGGASTTQFTLLSGDTIKNTTASTTVISGTLTPDILTVTGATSLASTTATSFKVGNSGTQMTKIVTGYCVTTAAFSVASSSGVYSDCTPYTAAGVAVSNLTVGSSRVFLQATSSLPAWIVIQAASTTATNLINVRMVNVSTSTVSASDTYTFNFWAFQ